MKRNKMSSKQKDKRVFTVKGADYAVIRPTNEDQMAADEERRKVFNKELSAGSLLREQLDEELRKRKLWNDERQMRYDTLRKEVLDNEYALKKGGIALSKAKDIAIATRKKRDEMIQMLSSRTELDSNTCEGKADNVRFNFLFASCLVYNDSGKKVFPNGLKDYLADMAHDAVGQGATEFYYLMSETDGVDEKLAENKFLKKYNFANEDYQLVDDQNRLIDEDGRHINKFGNYVEWISDDECVPVDFHGRKLDDDGDYIVEDAEPFLDDSGKPVEDPSEEKQEEVKTEGEKEQKSPEE